MTEVRKSASLHPQTVTDYSTGALVTQRPRVSGQRISTRHWQVHPRVWSHAVQLAEGEAARIQILSPTEVVVHNSRKWRSENQQQGVQGPSAQPDLVEESH